MTSWATWLRELADSEVGVRQKNLRAAAEEICVLREAIYDLTGDLVASTDHVKVNYARHLLGLPPIKDLGEP